MISYLHDQIHWGERLSRAGSGAHIGTSPAFHTGVKIDQLVLTEIFDFANSEAFLCFILEINRR